MSSLDGGLESVQGRTGPSDDRPLTQQEFQLLQRLLSDPFSLPIQYKTWLVSYLETSDMNLPMSSIQGLTSLLGIAGVGSGTLGILPAGLIIPYGGNVAPTGAKMCDGAIYTRAAETRLFNAIGANYGAPDALSFRVPDIQGRMPVGRGSHVDVDALGKSDGLPLASRRPKHKTSLVDPGHSHTPLNGTLFLLYNQGTSQGADGTQLKTTPSTASAQTGITAGPQTGAEPVDQPAFVVVNFIIVA
jgi:microcystin-dependent protein